MYSPTTNILNSIQALKTKLRDDHHQLQFIRKEFFLPVTKELPQQNEPDTQPNQYQPAYHSTNPNDVNLKSKMAEVRKKYSMQIKCLKKSFQEEKRKIQEQYEQQYDQMKQKYEQRIKQQQDYISLLEDQLSCSSRSVKNANLEKTQENIQKQDLQKIKYECMINNLIQQNAMLVQMIEDLKKKDKMNLRKKQNSLFQDKSRKKQQQQQDIQRISSVNKNRLKFSKVDSQSQQSRRRSSFASSDYSSVQPNDSQINSNNQNMDTSNFLVSRKESGNEWSDDSIMNDETKIKTIKHFWTNQQVSIHEFR